MAKIDNKNTQNVLILQHCIPRKKNRKWQVCVALILHLQSVQFQVLVNFSSFLLFVHSKKRMKTTNYNKETENSADPLFCVVFLVISRLLLQHLSSLLLFTCFLLL